jgi:hypothetical protein
MLSGATSKVIHGAESFESSFKSIDSKSVSKIYSGGSTKSVISHVHISRQRLTSDGVYIDLVTFSRPISRELRKGRSVNKQ